MKPAPFEYFAPISVSEALQLLSIHGYSGKVLAGGQSLIPAMNFRMATPAVLVDLNFIPELNYIRQMDNEFLIGTMTPDSVVELDAAVLKHAPMIGQAMDYIAHPQVRNRGTFGGAMAHADPAGQLPGVAVALECRMRIRSAKGERWVDADLFFEGPFTTVIQPDELLVEVVVPFLKPRSGSSYQQVARQKGAQAQVAVCTRVDLDENGRVKKANIVVLCVGERPLLCKEGASKLVGQMPTNEAIQAASLHVAHNEIDPGTDIHATADYRRHVTAVLTRRALIESVKAAKKGA